MPWARTAARWWNVIIDFFFLWSNEWIQTQQKNNVGVIKESVYCYKKSCIMVGQVGTSKSCQVIFQRVNLHWLKRPIKLLSLRSLWMNPILHCLKLYNLPTVMCLKCWLSFLNGNGPQEYKMYSEMRLQTSVIAIDISNAKILTL